jgi:hypothetical protein
VSRCEDWRGKRRWRAKIPSIVAKFSEKLL